MKFDAFQMISLGAAMVVMFGQSVKLGIYAVALVDIPNAKSPIKFAHVELGIDVTVDFDYGTMKVEVQAVDILEFYHLVLQASSQQKETLAADEERGLIAEDEKDIIPQYPNQGHTFLVTSGLWNNCSSTDRPQNGDWVVRGGSFSFVVGCKMAAQDVKLVDENGKTVNPISSEGPLIFARPMHLKEAMSKSEMKIEILQDGVAHAKWDDESQDPSKSSQGNNVDDLLDNNAGSKNLMMGVLMQDPPAIMSRDTLKAFNILAQGERAPDAKKHFPETESPKDAWNPSELKDDAEQWDDVHIK
ncbi:uncharacterized protein BKA55DRAFT_744059 [Fusarium redolens]|uniref:DUF6603 domain-containing protein n=1 Tax=Fusarium redolens TaxID=48865 RepID=A0A9P9FYK7_FUSRE|nr:uncharacterized protein BKA55DRAFT_744059 [Fusarium redolens]KAH7216991.1 hypothetical protein BKA55DRAFT_744059 [Fusarium redolens]